MRDSTYINNNYPGVVDESGKKIFKKKLSNDPEIILTTLDPLRDRLAGAVVESTFNWYWLVDLLMDSGYPVHLANPAAIQKYKGLKHSSDVHDAFWLAEMLRLDILPTGYIYPKEERAIRDLLRKRGHLVKLRTSLSLSVKNIVARNSGRSVKQNEIIQLKKDLVTPLFGDNEDLALAGRMSKEVIDCLTTRINRIERFVLSKLELKESYQYLTTMPGVGLVLGLTIMLETGDVTRFSNVGNYSSYCRKVPSYWTSNGKVKGKGNKKNGNKYLAWAFSEAVELGRRYSPEVQAYYNRKLNKTNRMTAHTALAHKYTRAAYYIMKDHVSFDSGRLFA